MISRRELKLRSKPWITPALRRSILIKNKLYKKFLKTRSSYYQSKFKYCINKLNHLIKISRKQYYNEYFSSCQGNPKKLWTGIKRIVNHKSKCKYIPTKISSNNIDVTEPKEIANTFNSYFAEIGNNLANTVSSTDTTPQQYLNNQTYDTFYLFPTSVSEIEAEISKINVKKATGPYSIPSNILRLLKTVISKPLETIFNAFSQQELSQTNSKLQECYQFLKTVYGQTCVIISQFHSYQFLIESWKNSCTID